MKTNYDGIASFYDRLSYLVFRNAQKNAQIQQLRFVTGNSEILICGGGSGWILEEINRLGVNDIKVTYLDSSAEMIRLAEKKKFEKISVEFIQSDILEFEAIRKYDIIITSFFFDNFLEPEAKIVFDKLDQILKFEGLWLFNDFTLQYGKGRWWKRVMISVMYLFFKITSHLSTSRLIEMKEFFNLNNYRIIDKQLFFNKFILSIVFKKNENIKER